MTMRDEFAERTAASVWGRWFDEADAEAMALARGARRHRRRRRGDEVPVEVVALLALADLREMVLDLAGAVDQLEAASPER
jgi:hypothetical protein